jgi:Zn-dependent M28 family amino/carboxypeptidase
MPTTHRILLVTVTFLALAVLAPRARAMPPETSALRAAVTVEAIRAHQAAFQAIADAHGGTRAAGTSGYEASAAYVAEQLAAAGYRVTRQDFQFPQFEELATPAMARLSPSPRDYTAGPGADFLTMTYSGSGEVTAAIQPTLTIIIPPGAEPNASTSGCAVADFPESTAGRIALIQRGTCPFQLKAANAQAAGAVGVIIFNEGQPGRTEAPSGTLGGPGVTIPVVGASFAVGEDLYRLSQEEAVTVRLFTATRTQILTTANILGDTLQGRDDRVVVVGAHLDSVVEGPGINDNGSGSAMILEIAAQMAALDIRPVNQVRFAFWAAEEAGLLGSTFYVSQLTEEDLQTIALNLNFDMVGSPNYVRFVYDGDGSDTPSAGPEGSQAVEALFLDYFADPSLGGGVPTAPTAFDGRSDYGPFIAVGIPAGGLFTGAEGIKTEEEAQQYGGTAGLAYDPCYHQACDTLENNNDEALDEMSDAAAHAVLTWAMTKAAVAMPEAAVHGPGRHAPAALQALDYRGPRLQR